MMTTLPIWNRQQSQQQPEARPSYYPPPGQFYGVNPALLNIAMRRYLVEQSKRAQPAMGTAANSGMRLSSAGLGSSRLRLRGGMLGGGLRNTGLGPNTGMAGLNRTGLYGSSPLRNRPILSGKMYGYGRQNGMGGNQPSPWHGAVTATGPNGHKIVVHNGEWVDAQTGQPIR